MTLWYGLPATASLSEALARYCSATQADRASVPRPTPLYAEDQPPSVANQQLTGG